MGLTIDEILASLENEKTAEEIFADNLAEKKAQEEPEVQEEVPEVVEAAPEETPEEAEVPGEPDEEKDGEVTPSEEKPAEEKTAEEKPAGEPVQAVAEEENQKLAEDLDLQGRLMARGFFDELVKLSEAANSETEPQPEENSEKVAEENADGTEILVNLYNRYYGGNN